MEPISFPVEAHLDDHKALQVAARVRIHRLGSRTERLLARTFGIVLIVAMVAGAAWIRSSNVRLAWVLGMAVAVLLVFAQSWVLLRRYRPLPNGSFFDPARFTLDTEGIRNTRSSGEGFVRWRNVLAVDVTATHVFVWLDSVAGYVWPARAFAPLTPAELADRMRGFMSDAGTAAAPVSAIVEGMPATSAAIQETVAGTVDQPSVQRELGAIGRLLITRPADGAALFGRELTILVATLILLAVWIPLEPLLYPEELEFSWYGLPELAWIVLGVLGLAWILSRLSRPRVEYRRTLLLAIGAMPMAIAASTFNTLDDRWFFVALAATMIWALLYLRLGLIAVSGRVQPRAMWAAVAATFGFVVVTDQLYMNPSFWAYAEDPEGTEQESPLADARDWQRMEQLQFEQNARLDAELSRIAMLPHETPAMFFVGFAGFGEQRVFAEEIALAQQQVAAKYGTAERSALLVNDRRDLAKLPLASAPALRYTLRRIGAMMEPDDVLFLALSSHGSEDGSISVSNVGRHPADLGAVELASMLREAKIPWKVVVVSACYAGSFIDALRDERTIVLAAAAPDRPSFGCSDDRDLTYFGEAFYRDALPKAATLRAAFDAARAEIGTREKQEGAKASDPQAWFGPLMESKLEQMKSAQPAPPRG